MRFRLPLMIVLTLVAMTPACGSGFDWGKVENGVTALRDAACDVFGGEIKTLPAPLQEAIACGGVPTVTPRQSGMIAAAPTANPEDPYCRASRVIISALSKDDELQDDLEGFEAEYKARCLRE